METIKHRGYTIEIHQDLDPGNPRTEWDNLGTMVCFHKRYNLGDGDHGYFSSDFDSWKDLKHILEKEENTAIILPVFMYDHGGITINTEGFSCPWDSGQIGFIFISRDKVEHEYGWKKITAKRREKLEHYLKSEIKTYDNYLTRNVFGYIVKDKGENEIDSCWGFYGDIDESGLKDYAIDVIECHLKNENVSQLA